MHLSQDGIGREPIHGLTAERFTPVRELSQTQNRFLQTWGIGFYNTVGGFNFQTFNELHVTDNPARRFCLRWYVGKPQQSRLVERYQVSQGNSDIQGDIHQWKNR